MDEKNIIESKSNTITNSNANINLDKEQKN